MTDHILQGLIWPDPALPHAPEVFVRLSENAVLGPAGLTLAQGAAAHFDTYANLFNLGTWAAHGPINNLALRLTGTGTVQLHLWQVNETNKQTLFQADISLSAKGTSLPITPTSPNGLLMWSITAHGSATLRAADFTGRAHADPIRLAIVITTFRREDAVRDTAGRIAAFLGAGHLPGAHLYIIDNGQSVSLPPSPHVTLIPNRNLGGAGGFARGLATARDASSFTHVLFMDDDAACALENLTRTSAFLRHATDPATALAGAMISAAQPWLLWENGARFDQVCHPQYPELDLRDLGAVTAMELSASKPKPADFYGGWWYFAFPIAAVRHDPFPFFVRGDDVTFALSNPFHMATLNGVMSVQDAFPAKASPQTVYLDTRYHLHVHIVQPALRLGPLGTIRVAMRQVLHSIVRMHYETAAAQLLAWEDMLQGPSLFTDNITMADKRAQIGRLLKTEKWGTVPADLPPTRDATRPPEWRLMLLRATLNGHMLPFFKLWGRAVTVPVADRGRVWSTSGASRAVFLDGAGQAYTVTHSKRRFARLMVRAAGLALRWVIAWPRLSQAYRTAFEPMTTPAFWAAQCAPFPDKG
ncbi:MAG: galactofuranosylgalactofuranosylrhamnosyl-N-acetylglucosaminyl-diphospho-decaprenol beta-1,5 [Loktanella salsilacus]|uniref:glycosyltransferase family 2 protein n=1 Tax=Loktanella salsilacus TaxID=195913 RepID=UPI003988A7F8